jgi:hypothetical protein
VWSSTWPAVKQCEAAHDLQLNSVKQHMTCSWTVWSSTWPAVEQCEAAHDLQLNSVKQHMTCSWTVLFTFVDKRLHLYVLISQGTVVVVIYIQLPVQSVAITNNVVSSNTRYTIMVIKFVRSVVFSRCSYFLYQ